LFCTHNHLNPIIMKTPITLALGLLALVSSAQPFNNTYDINLNFDQLSPAYVITNAQNEAISVSNGTNGQADYYILTKIDQAGNPIYNNIVSTNNAPTDGFTHVEALHETLAGNVLVAGYYYRDRNNIVEWPFLSCFDTWGNCLWTRIYPVNQNKVNGVEINKVSICRAYDKAPAERYLLVFAGDSEQNPGVGVATNVIKVDIGGNLIFSHKYYNTNTTVASVREYPGDIEFSPVDRIYMITGSHWENNNQTMFYFGIDNAGNTTTPFMTLQSNSTPIDQDMIYDAATNSFPTVFTHTNSTYVPGIQSQIGFIRVNTAMAFFSPTFVWHQAGSRHNGRSISATNRAGEYMLGAGVLDNAGTFMNNPALVRINAGGITIPPMYRYNILDNVYFGHHTWDNLNPNPNNEFVLIGEHRTDMREIRTDNVILGEACGVRQYSPIHQAYTPSQKFYQYNYRQQNGMIPYQVKENKFIPPYRKCVPPGNSYRTTGIAQWSMDNENISLYPSVLSSQQNYLTLENNTGSELRVEVRNIAGQLIFSAEQIGAGKNEINPGIHGHLPTGIYLVNVFNSQGQLSNSTKIIVNP
jgi:hypothetical protein